MIFTLMDNQMQHSQTVLSAFCARHPQAHRLEVFFAGSAYAPREGIQQYLQRDAKRYPAYGENARAQ